MSDFSCLTTLIKGEFSPKGKQKTLKFYITHEIKGLGLFLNYS